MPFWGKGSFRYIQEFTCIDVLKKYSSDLNGIMISHKLDMLTRCTDEIYVLQKGKIVNKGHHTDLLNSCGLYQNLWNQYKKETL